MKRPASRVKEAELVPAAITTDFGAESKLLTVDRRTVAPPAGAFAVIVTVQVLEANGPSVAGLQVSEESSNGATRLTVVLLELPL